MPKYKALHRSRDGSDKALASTPSERRNSHDFVSQGDPTARMQIKEVKKANLTYKEIDKVMGKILRTHLEDGSLSQKLSTVDILEKLSTATKKDRPIDKVHRWGDLESKYSKNAYIRFAVELMKESINKREIDNNTSSSDTDTDTEMSLSDSSKKVRSNEPYPASAALKECSDTRIREHIPTVKECEKCIDSMKVSYLATSDSDFAKAEQTISEIRKYSELYNQSIADSSKSEYYENLSDNIKKLREYTDKAEESLASKRLLKVTELWHEANNDSNQVKGHEVYDRLSEDRRNVYETSFKRYEALYDNYSEKISELIEAKKLGKSSLSPYYQAMTDINKAVNDIKKGTEDIKTLNKEMRKELKELEKELEFEQKVYDLTGMTSEQFSRVGREQMWEQRKAEGKNIKQMVAHAAARPDIGWKGVMERAAEIIPRVNKLQSCQFIVEAIGESGDRSMAKDLVKMLPNEQINPTIRCYIGQALGTLGEQSVAKDLVKMLPNERIDACVRESIIDALSHWEEESTATQLMEIRDNDQQVDPKIREQIGRLLQKWGYDDSVGENSALEILRQRYARGEIDSPAFEYRANASYF